MNLVELYVPCSIHAIALVLCTCYSIVNLQFDNRIGPGTVPGSICIFQNGGFPMTNKNGTVISL